MTAEPDVTQWGPQPYEGLVSVICESFQCAPEEAERQDWALVQAVLDYRTAVTAKEVFNGKDKRQAFDTLKQHPSLLQMLSMMKRAQEGQPLDGPRRMMEKEGMAVAADYRETESED